MEKGWIFGCFQGNMSVYHENRRGREGGKEREVKKGRGMLLESWSGIAPSLRVKEPW